MDDAWLEDFFFQLREQGFAVDARHLTAATKVLSASILEGVAPARIQSRLSPIFAKNPQDQAQFKSLFSASMRDLGLHQEAALTPENQGAASQLRQKLIAIAAAVLAATAVLLVSYFTYSHLSDPPEQIRHDPIDIHDVPVEREPPRERIPHETEPTPRPDAPKNPQSILVQDYNDTPEPPPWQALIAAIPVAALVGWFFWRWLSDRSWIGRRSGKSNKIGNHPAAGALFAQRGFRRSAQELRRHRDEPTNKINVPATVEATVNACGQFEPVMATRAATPEYLALIERFHRDDHVTRLATAATARLRAEGVAISDYFFGYAPQICRDATGKAISLEKLSEAASDNRLIVIGSADGFVDPLTEEPEPWVERLSAWRDRTLFSARRIRHWGPGEAGLLDEGLNLATATPRGIAAYADLPVNYASEGGGALLEGRRVSSPATTPVTESPKPSPQPANLPREPRKIPRAVAALGGLSAIAASLLIAYVATPVFDTLTGHSLTLVTPYTLSAEREPDGRVVANGHAPDENSRKLIEAALVAQARTDAEIEVSLARGAPVDEWADAVSEIIAALGPADSWRLSARDAAIQIEGVAPRPETRDQIAEQIASITRETGLNAQIDLRTRYSSQSSPEPIAAQLYSQIISSPQALALPEFRAAETGGPATSRVFVRASGLPLNTGIAGIYSYDGFHSTFIPQLLIAMDDMSRVPDLGDPGVLADLQSDILSLYSNDFVREFDALLGDVDVVPIESLLHAVEVTNVLSGPISPIVNLLQAVAVQTDLTKRPGTSLTGVVRDPMVPSGFRRVLEREVEKSGKQIIGPDTANSTNPGQYVSDRFQWLRDYVGQREGQPAPIDETLSLLTDLYRLTNRLSFEGSSSSTELGFAVDRLEIHAARTPEPVARWLRQIIEPLDASVNSRVASVRSDFEVFRDCTECPDMIALPAGTFVMGSPEDEEGRDTDEGPQREVRIDRFAMAATEVTFDQWQACVDDGGCQSNPSPDDQGWGRGTRPVINVSWNHAQEYVDWLNGKGQAFPEEEQRKLDELELRMDAEAVTGRGPTWRALKTERDALLASLRRGSTTLYRLPSEAEWEYAARAGTTTPFAFGETISADQANFLGERSETVPVEDLDAANDWGLRHMHGNVWELVEDCWNGDYSGAPVDGSAWLSSQSGNCERRVLRGGSWGYIPMFLRSADRDGFEPDDRNWDIGFRPARTLLTP